MTLFDLDTSFGKMSLEHSVPQMEKISGRSSRRLSISRTVPVMCLDLTPGAGNLLGLPFWEINSAWLGESWIPSREDSYERLQEMAVQFPEENRSVEDQILKKIECEQLHKFLLELSKEEQWLIQELYFEERTEREVASVLGLSQKAINKRRQKILEKLRKLF